jgi:N-acetylglucosaminyldiphosphoundecaprenol N-acetyl-beta-D-mannosaminyltransferase
MTVDTGSARFNDGADRQWSVPVATIGGLPIALIDRAESAKIMVDAALSRRGRALPPLIVASANGQVLSMCASDPYIRDLFLAADLIHADGMPLVLASRLLHKHPVPERVCTTDLFHDVSAVAQKRAARVFLLGGTDAVMAEAARRARALYPDLNIVGQSGGYFHRPDGEECVIDAINAAQPDILFLGLGVPREQEFALRNRDRLTSVGLIKTSGGLFDFLSGAKARAPVWMRNVGLEWAYRTYLEPRRLSGRYLATNPHAVFLLLTRTARVGALSAHVRELHAIQ